MTRENKKVHKEQMMEGKYSIIQILKYKKMFIFYNA